MYGAWSMEYLYTVGQRKLYGNISCIPCSIRATSCMILPAPPGQYYSYIVRNLLHGEIFMSQRGPHTIVATGDICK